MRYLIVANLDVLNGYCKFCDGTFLALYCETKRNGYSSFPSEYLLLEEMCFVGSKVTLPDFDVLVVWDKTNLAQILTVLGERHPRVCILNEMLELLTNNYINSFEYNLCVHCILQRKNYPSEYSIMPDFISILTHQITLPVANSVKEISRTLQNNYLQNKIQNGIINTFSPATILNLKELLENSILLDKFFTSNTYHFLHDLKSLYFVSKLRITSFLWGQGEQFLLLDLERLELHLSKCDSNFGVKVFRSIISLFDGFKLCDDCKLSLQGIYNSNTEINYNLQIIKNFCDKYGYFFSTKSNGNFKITTGISEWILDITVNSSKVTNLFHKSSFEGGSCRNKGKKRKLFKQGYHLQPIGCHDLIYVLNYIHMHDLAKQEEQQRIGCSFISEKYIQKNFR